MNSLVDFYCLITFTPLSATVRGSDRATFPVSFSAANASTLFASGQSVLPHLLWAAVPPLK
jgi:hypothetical protein